MTVCDDWFTLEPSGSDLGLPGVFGWEIGGAVAYVGRATPLRAGLCACGRNLDHIGEGQVYRPDDPGGFRAIHEALDAARSAGEPIRFRVIETVPPGAADLNKRKMHWVAELRPTLNRQPRPRRTT
jgi:hypothetical protein